VTEPARINESELLVTAVVGEVTSPSMPANPYEVDADGRPVVPVGAGGICYNVRVGMDALGWAGSEVEPGVSIANPVEAANDALSVYACVGNRVTVRSGAAAGAEGVVTGKHEAFMAYRHVLVDLEPDALERLAPGDQLVARAWGRGMRVEDIPDVVCHSLGVELWRAWAPSVADNRLTVRVGRVLPPEVVGMGSGRVSAATSVALQRGVPGEGSDDVLGELRLGDLVAVRDWQATYYTGYRDASVSIGVVASGDSPILGNGPALTLLLSGPAAVIEPVVDPDANLATLLGLA